MITTFRRFAVAAILILLSPSPWADTPTPASQPESPAPTELDLKINRQQARVEAINAKLQAEHQKIGATIGRIVNVTVSLRDSRESGTMAVQIKENVIKDLGKLVRFYKDEQTRVRQMAQMESSPAAKEMWEQQVAKASTLIEERISQILSITESLSVYADGAYLSRNDDSSVVQTAANRAGNLGEKVRVAVRKDKERLEQENDALRKDLKRAPDEEKRAEIERKISENETIISRRDEQLVEVVTGAAGGQRTVKRSALMDYNQEIRHDMNDLRNHYDTLLEIKHLADKERRALALLEDQRAAKP